MPGRFGRQPFRDRLKRDPQFAAESKYCFDKGIPHSEFLDRWSDADRAKVIAQALDSAERCSSCGTAPWEWEEDPEAYVAVRVACSGCQARALVLEDRQAAAPPGTSVTLMPRAAALRLSETLRIKRDERKARRAMANAIRATR